MRNALDSRRGQLANATPLHQRDLPRFVPHATGALRAVELDSRRGQLANAVPLHQSRPAAIRAARLGRPPSGGTRREAMILEMGLAQSIKLWATHPLLRPHELGSPEWFAAQSRLFDEKPLVQRCYALWYELLLHDADSVEAPGAIVELGSGSSRLKLQRPSIIASDVVPGAVDLVADGRSLPFRDQSVRALLLTHVFHHIPDVAAFLREADRVLVPGGVISMVDCAHTPFSRFFFGKVHPEPYRDDAAQWSFPPGNTMLDSNQALTWIVFERDRAKFEAANPGLRIERRRWLPWFSYLMSGGVNLRSFVPGPLGPLARGADWLLQPVDPLFAIHWHWTIRKATRAGR